MLIGVISDTHIPGRAARLPDDVHRIFEGADLIIHAGDVIERSVLDELSVIAEVVGVRGNCDPLNIGLPGTLTLAAEGVLVGVVHDSGRTEGRRERMRASFPECRAVVFGHSHVPLSEDDGSLLLLNPGSACDPRWGSKLRSVALLTVTGQQLSAQIVEVSV